MTTTSNSSPRIGTIPRKARHAHEQERVIDPVRRGPVLLATDGGNGIRATASIAHAIAMRLGVTVEVVTVLEPFGAYASVDFGGLAMTFDEERRHAHEMLVLERLADVTPSARDWPMHVRLGSTAREIASVARDRRASMIVVGAGQHRRLRRLVAGSLASRVLREADCPVLSVAPNQPTTAECALVATDFAPPSLRAAQLALLLLEECGHLTLLHVLPPLDLDRSGKQPRHGEELAARAFERLRVELEPYIPPGAVVETRVATGAVLEEIWGVADETRAQLIAVGTHGPTVLERVLVGSTAAGVLHAATANVVACPPPLPIDALELRLLVTDSAVTSERDVWDPLLAHVTQRNAGRLASVEVDSPALGAQTQVSAMRFAGAAYDHHDGRVVIMLSDEIAGRGHLARSIGGITSLALSVDDVGRDHALDITQGETHTLLVFR